MGKIKQEKKKRKEQNNNNKIKENEIRKVKKKKENAIFFSQTGSEGEEVSEKEREREKRGVEREKLISKIYENRIVGFHRSKRQSRSTHQELRVGTEILKFVKLHEIENFPTWVISNLKVI